MKTNAFARSILQVRVTVLCLAIVGLALAEVGFGTSLASRCGQYSARQTDSAAAPSVGISDMMAAAR
jgi:hypothetical protein